MMKRCLAGILALAFLPTLSVAAEHFTVTQDAKGVWWFRKPGGGQFLSIGINNVNWWGEASRAPGNPNPYFDWFNAHYPNLDWHSWSDDTARSLLNLGLNTAGAWSEEALANATAENGSWLAVTPNLHLGEDYLDREKAWYADHATRLMREGKSIAPLVTFPDVYFLGNASRPGFEAFATESMRAKWSDIQSKVTASDTRILGWFTDNELRWAPDWKVDNASRPENADIRELLGEFLNRPDSQGRQVAVDLLNARYSGKIADFNATWKTSFVSWQDLRSTHSWIKAPFVRPNIYDAKHGSTWWMKSLPKADQTRAVAWVQDCDLFLTDVSRRYFEVTGRVLRQVDPGRLNLGCRFAYLPYQATIQESVKVVDVISFNFYRKMLENGSNFSSAITVDAIDRFADYGAAASRPLMVTEFAYVQNGYATGSPEGAGILVDNQSTRARKFREYAQIMLKKTNIIGYHWYQYCDQPAEGRADGNGNLPYGIITRDNEPYVDLQASMREIAQKAMDLHEGTMTTNLVTIATSTDRILEGGAPTIITLTRVGNLATPLNVVLKSVGTAESGRDFGALAPSFTIPAGSASASFSISAVQDGLEESTESARITIVDSPTYQVGNARTAVISIVDVPPPTVVTLQATDVQASENGDSGTFIISRSGYTSSPLVVHLSFSGTANPGSDYQVLPTTITLPAGAASTTLIVRPQADALTESAETVSASLVADSGYQMGATNSATVTIADVPPPVVVTLNTTDGIASESGDPGVITLSRSGSTTSALSVTLRWEGTATMGTDYENLPSMVTIPVGQSSVNLSVRPLADKVLESTESVTATVVSGAGYVLGSTSSATVAITDVPPPVVVSLGATDAVASESGDPGVITLSRSGATTSALAVTLRWDGTATMGTDYESLPSVVSIPLGQSSVNLTVRPLADTDLEPTESVTATVVSGAGYVLGSASSATVSITDVPPPPAVSMAVTDAQADERGAVGRFLVRRTTRLDLPVTVNLQVSGSAIPGVDYEALPSSITIPSGVESVSLVVTPRADTIMEPNETVEVTLVPGKDYRLAGATFGTVVIADRPGIDVHINFQPSTVLVPTGWLADLGNAKGPRAGGLTYGWNQDMSTLMRVRGRLESSTDIMHDTLVVMQKAGQPTSSWEIDLPNGLYLVHLIAGDAQFTDSHYRLAIQDLVVLEGTPTTSSYWIEGEELVSVTNGVLRLTNAPGSSNNKLCSLEIRLAPTGTN